MLTAGCPLLLNISRYWFVFIFSLELLLNLFPTFFFFWLLSAFMHYNYDFSTHCHFHASFSSNLSVVYPYSPLNYKFLGMFLFKFKTQEANEKLHHHFYSLGWTRHINLRKLVANSTGRFGAGFHLPIWIFPFWGKNTCSKATSGIRHYTPVKMSVHWCATVHPSVQQQLSNWLRLT